MSDQRIVCTEQEPFNQPVAHAHIVAVGVGSDAQKAERRLTLQQVFDAMANGDTFYTVGAEGVRAPVEKVACPQCKRYWIIKTVADGLPGNNLDGGIRCCRTFTS